MLPMTDSVLSQAGTCPAIRRIAKMETMDIWRLSPKDGWNLGAEPLAEQFVSVLGVRFDRITTMQAVEQMLHWIAEKSRRMIITAGPEFVMKTTENERLQKIAHAAD